MLFFYVRFCLLYRCVRPICRLGGKEIYLIFEFIDMDLTHLLKSFEKKLMPRHLVQVKPCGRHILIC